MVSRGTGSSIERCGRTPSDVAGAGRCAGALWYGERIGRCDEMVCVSLYDVFKQISFVVVFFFMREVL